MAENRGVPIENRLLGLLPADDYERLLPNLRPVSFSLGEVVYEFGGQLDYVFFPTTSIVSLLYTMENGTSAEMGLTGDRKSTRLNSSHGYISYAVFCLKKKKKYRIHNLRE